MMNQTNNQSAAFRVTWIGAAANLVLTALKFVAGVFGNSSAMVADAAHSLSDLISDAVVLVGLKISAKPQDESHHYGHGKVETSTAVFIGMMLAAAGFYIFWSGARDLYLDRQTNPGLLALLAAIVSIVVKEILYQVTARIGVREKKPSLVANAWHHRSDALSSVAALAGIGGDMLGVPHLDQIAAIAVSLFVIRAGALISWNAYKDLVDTAVETKHLMQMEKVIKSADGVIGFHKLRTRKVGAVVLIDLHLVVEGRLTLDKAHEIADRVEEKLKTDLEVDDITVHVEPYRCNRPKECFYPDCDTFTL